MRTFQLNKLVRDKIVQLQQVSGGEVNYEKITGPAYLQALVAKLKEESEELQASNKKELLKELADIQEVIDAIVIAIGETREQLQHQQAAKREKAGGFEEGLYIHSVTLQDSDAWAAYYAREPNRFPEITPSDNKA